jgi:hypothetical protein
MLTLKCLLLSVTKQFSNNNVGPPFISEFQHHAPHIRIKKHNEEDKKKLSKTPISSPS